MAENEAIAVIKNEKECVLKNIQGCDRDCGKCDLVMEDNVIIEGFDMAISALEVQKKITEIVNRQLIAGKNNYKEIYDCFYEIVKIIQDNY